MIKVEVRDNGTLRKLRNMADKVGRLEVPHKRIAAYLDAWVHKNFRTEGGQLTDGPWVPFAQGGRVLPNGEIDTTAKLLQDTRTMLLGFSAQNAEINREHVIYGNAVPYSEKHEEGEGWVPQRRMLPRSEEILDDVMDIYRQYIDEVENA